MKTRSPRLRANVGIMIINRNRQVLAGEALHYRGEWMMPQGGIDRGEAPYQAMKRELFEETSIRFEDVKFKAEHPQWINYRFRQPLKKEGILYDGQRQKWYLLHYDGPVPDAKSAQDQEFHCFDWVEFDWLLEHTTEFKVQVYQQVYREFKKPIVDLA